MNRILISFQGKCLINCKHCYVHEIYEKTSVPDKEQIPYLLNQLDSANKDDFDIVYISRRRENFIDEEAGVSLAKAVFKKCKKHILIITRAPLSDECIDNLAILQEEMEKSGKVLIVAVSIPANQSYGMLEDIAAIPPPEARCEVLKKIHSAGISTILMARPLMPDRMIPISEVVDMIGSCKEFVDSVVSSGIAVNKPILKRLGLEEKDFTYLSGNNLEYLIGSDAKDIMYVDVKKEMLEIENYCKSIMMPFFDHSMKAVEYLIRKYGLESLG